MKENKIEIQEINARLDEFEANLNQGNEMMISMFAISLVCWGICFGAIWMFIVLKGLDIFNELKDGLLKEKL